MGFRIEAGHSLSIYFGGDIAIGQLFRCEVATDISKDSYQLHFVHALTFAAGK